LAILVAGCSSSGTRPTPVDAGPRQATILVFSDLRGTLKPCGCSPDLQRGGVARVTDHVEKVRKSTPDAALFHAGDLLIDDEGIPKVRGAQITRRTEAIAASLQRMGLTAATLGPHDLKEGLDWLEKHLPLVKAPIVVTNVAGPRWGKLVSSRLLLKVGAVRVGVIGLVPSSSPGATDAKAAAIAAAEALRREGADVVIALSSLGLRQSKRLLRKGIGVDMLLAAGQGLKALVTDEVEPFDAASLFQSYVQGGQVGRVDIVANGGGAVTYVEPTKMPPAEGSHFRYALTPIGWDLPQNAEVAAIMKAYDGDLKAINLASAGTLPELKPGQASYVGVQKCLECHEETKTFWEKDQHAKAWHTLVVDNKTFDLECVSCHATGYGKAGGSILGAMKNLTDVQCEVCHGPGSAHVEDESAESIRLQVKQFVCVKCHNKKHSTGFNYDMYRSRLLVPGHGKPLK